MKKFTKRIVSVALIAVISVMAMVSMSGCSEARRVNHNIAKQAQYFDCERRITVYNALSDEPIMMIEGYMNIENNTSEELVVTCKVGSDEYKLNYVYLNAFTIYVVEDISGTHTDPYHYKLYFHTSILPDVDVKP